MEKQTQICNKCTRPLIGDRLGKEISKDIWVCEDEIRCSKPFVMHMAEAKLKPMKGLGPTDGKLSKVIVEANGYKGIAFVIEKDGHKNIICPACGRTGDNPSLEWERIKGFVYHEGCTEEGLSNRDLMKFWVEYAPEEDIHKSIFHEIL